MKLNSKNIELKALRKKDRKKLASIANNKNIWDNVRDIMPYPYSVKDAKDFIAYTKITDNHLLSIWYKGKMAGMIGLHPQSDVYKNSAEIGYWISEKHWGKGIASKAVKMMSKHAFKNLGMTRIYAGVFEYNTGSMKVLENNGYILEGIRSKAITKNGKLHDEYLFAKLSPVLSKMNKKKK